MHIINIIQVYVKRSDFIIFHYIDSCFKLYFRRNVNQASFVKEVALVTTLLLDLVTLFAPGLMSEPSLDINLVSKQEPDPVIVTEI